MLITKHKKENQAQLMLGMTLAALSLFLALFSPALAGQNPAPPIKALIITGQNYHNWKTTSAVLKQILEDTGLFQVDIAVSPPAKGDMKSFRPDFSPYRLVVLDYSGDAWSPSTQKSFAAYVKNGGGVVVYHSADNTFPDWPEYNEIIGLGGWGGRTEKAGPYVFWKDSKVVQDTGPGVAGYHTSPHEFLVINRDPIHPITAGLPQKWMHAKDELYSLLRGPAENLTVLATAYFAPERAGTGRDEPVLFTVQYGAGRVFHTVLGHAEVDGPQPALECVGFIVTFQRGAEWAATGQVTKEIPTDFPATNRDFSTPEDVRRWPGYRPPSLDAILKELTSFEYSKNEDVLYRLREYVLTHKNSAESRAACEETLLGFLSSSANLDARLAVCRQLRLVGSDRSVPVLEEMLLTPETTDMARYALEKIPGFSADQALINALGKTQGGVKIGLISSLGRRQPPEAAKELRSLLFDQDGAIASAAATALGRIGNAEATTIIAEAFDKAQGDNRVDIAFSLVQCAEKLLSGRNYDAAGQLFERILAPSPQPLPLVLRQTAMKGKLEAAERDKAAELILDILGRGPQDMQEPAISLTQKIFGESAIGPVCALLPKLPEASQIQLLAVLASYSRGAVQPVVINAAKSPVAAVRIAALKALSKLGDSSTVALLADRAVSAKGEEQAAARNSLWTIPGKDVDEAILFGIVSSASEPVLREFIQAVGERQIYSGKGLLMSQAGSASPGNSLEAAKALRAIASPQDVPALVDVLLGMSDETAQEEMQNTIGSAAQKITDPYARGNAVELRLEPGEQKTEQKVTDVPKRCLLYRTLGKIGDDSSLPLLRAALRGDNAEMQDAAVRALIDWPSAAPREDCLTIARTSPDLTRQVLALRGYMRMIGLEKYQSPEGAVHSLKMALDLATRPDEKKLVLGALPDFACPEALALAESLLNTEDVQAEAQAAVDKIRESQKSK
jgi:HEAT repeat protein